MWVGAIARDGTSSVMDVTAGNGRMRYTNRLAVQYCSKTLAGFLFK